MTIYKKSSPNEEKNDIGKRAHRTKPSKRASKKEDSGLANQRQIVGDILGLQCVDHPQQLLGNMGHGNLMGLSLSPLLGVIFSENRFVRNKWKAAVEKGAAEMRRAMLNHVAGGFKQTRLKIARFQTRESEHLRRTLEFTEITVLREDDGGGRSPDAGDGEHGRVNTTDTFFNLVIQFLHLGVQLCVKFQQDRHFMEKEVSRTAN